jgi:hypothetical protein
MGGGLMQLVAYGAQDIYLTGNPQITFFKVVYRRHTNFSMETIQQTISGASQLSGSATSTGTVTVSRNGDLVSKVWVRCNQDNTDGVSGDKLIQDVEVEIGGQKIDKHNEEWLQLWAELTTPESKAEGYKYLSGGFINDLMPSTTATTSTDQQSIMVPLQFWFCRNPGLALPLIALQYHEVKLKFTWNSTNSKARDDGNYTSQPTCEVWCDYIYLDTDERRRFAQVSHEYLIEQLQRQTEGSANTDYKLNFNHPVIELIFAVRRQAAEKCNSWFDYSGIDGRDPVVKACLNLNNQPRFQNKPGPWLRMVQPYQFHSNIPETFIYVYSFALHPEDSSPSGSCNMSRIDHVTLTLTLQESLAQETVTVLVYARNFNVLRFKEGLAGLAFANSQMLSGSRKALEIGF